MRRILLEALRDVHAPVLPYNLVQSGSDRYWLSRSRHILWATNFPLANSTWPDVRHFVERGLSGAPEDERHKILWQNAAKLYQIS